MWCAKRERVAGLPHLVAAFSVHQDRVAGCIHAHEAFIGANRRLGRRFRQRCWGRWLRRAAPVQHEDGAGLTGLCRHGCKGRARRDWGWATDVLEEAGSTVEGRLMGCGGAAYAKACTGASTSTCTSTSACTFARAGSCANQ